MTSAIERKRAETPERSANDKDHRSNGSESMKLLSHLGAKEGRARGTYELKFLVDDDRAATILAWARERLAPDPHADPRCEDGYQISSVYLDTPHLDIFNRSRFFRFRKYRLRRYGIEPVVWLEQKTKRHGRVRKRRLSIDDSQFIERLVSMDDRAWEGEWFRRRLREFRLSPVTAVTYFRSARVGDASAGAIRLTIDADVRISSADGWHVRAQLDDGLRILPDRQILELKFRESLPPQFRDLIREFELLPTTFSKYRSSVGASGAASRIAGEVWKENADA